MIWWTQSWNPITGCTPCSEACANCYAEALHTQRHKALLAGKKMPKCYSTPFDRVRFLPERQAAPLRWRTPQRVFVCNMGDLFHEYVPMAWVDEVFLRMALCRRHTFMLLTKRPERAQAYLEQPHLLEHLVGCAQRRWGHDGGVVAQIELQGLTVLPNVWLGTTIWNQASADRAVPILLSTPAARRFVSVEPMLGPVDLGRYFSKCYWCEICGERQGYGEPLLYRCASCGHEANSSEWGDGDFPVCPNCGESDNEDFVCRGCGNGGLKFDFPTESYPIGLDWVICGGETGKNARPMHPDWPRNLRDQCQAAEVPFFFKQWGEWAPWEFEGTAGGINKTGGRYHYKVDSFGKGAPRRFGARRAGRVLDGRTWEEVPNA